MPLQPGTPESTPNQQPTKSFPPVGVWQKDIKPPEYYRTRQSSVTDPSNLYDLKVHRLGVDFWQGIDTQPKADKPAPWWKNWKWPFTRHAKPQGVKGFWTPEEIQRILYHGQIYAKRFKEIEHLLHDAPHPTGITELAQAFKAIAPEGDILMIRDRKYGTETIDMDQPTKDRVVNHIMTNEVGKEIKDGQHSILSPQELTYVQQLIQSGTPTEEVREVVDIILREISHKVFTPNPTP